MKRIDKESAQYLERLENAGILFTFGELERMSIDELREWIYILEDEVDLTISK